jgi:hypothetical protein
MEQQELNALQYPIGKFQKPEKITETLLQTWIQSIADLPQKVRKITENLTNEQLDTPYRPEGWTVRQVVHHLGDSHINAYTRFKLALTEDNPIIKPYNEEAWAELADTKYAPIEPSIVFLEALHIKWVYLLKGLTSEQLKRTFIHPASQNQVSLDRNIGLYAWHSDHHFAHIEHLVKRMNW